MSFKVLGQTTVTADTDTTLYTVPAFTDTVLSSIVVTNRGSTAATFRVAVRPDGAAIANQHYLYFDVPLEGNSTFVFTGGVTINGADVVTVRSNSADVNFSVFGKEVST